MPDAAIHHASTRERRQRARDLIAEILTAHDTAQQRDPREHHEGNRHETAGVIYERIEPYFVEESRDSESTS